MEWLNLMYKNSVYLSRQWVVPLSLSPDSPPSLGFICMIRIYAKVMFKRGGGGGESLGGFDHVRTSLVSACAQTSPVSRPPTFKHKFCIITNHMYRRGESLGTRLHIMVPLNFKIG